jgi:hypothetical protein
MTADWLNDTLNKSLKILRKILRNYYLSQKVKVVL